ncbi:endonuclease/exonuclease/phosphatase family protein [Chryseobacterium sp. 5_R23647]|uniref:endonuclease/exonuclease/phosphatase family protein n=1 Tax=Chryseobacterium sp. 5_R23647 TaxID=2258964 RepID=UPI000E277BBF|nr:endonuclease/exonuclease/phosphatase family protein [Chryseobacterium sp. 5_R23647]REC45748.1 AP endonuclease [Chryseobacterium sp. 5_R23647]
MKIFRLILFILHLGLLFLLTGVLLNAYIPPKIFPWFNLLSLGFPLLVIGYILITFFWIFSWKKRAFVFMFMGLFFLNPVKRWINYSSERKETANLKIVTFNIKGGILGKEEIQEYINAQKADLVFIQEYGDGDLKLKNLTGKNTVPINSLYTNYKIVSRKNLFENLYDGDITAQCEQIDLEIRGKIYRVINVHLESFGVVKSMVKLNGNGEEDETKVKNLIKRLIPTFKSHQEQVQIIRKSIDTSPYPVIVAGDFNAVPNSYEYYKTSEGLKDAFYEAGRGSGTSFHDYKYPLRIDYIFTSESIKPVSYKVDRSVNLSDHFPVIATFKIN